MAGELVASRVENDYHGWIIRETFALGGWVALWRPLEIFLYDWWPIQGEAKLLDRLSDMGVSVHGATVATTSTMAVPATPANRRHQRGGTVNKPGGSVSHCGPPRAFR